MVINSSAVGMTAQTHKKTSYTQTNESLVTCLNTGAQSYSGNFLSEDYESSTSGKSFAAYVGASGDVESVTELKSESSTENETPALSDNYDYMKQKAGRNNLYGMSGNSKILSLRQNDSTLDLISQLRLFLLNFRNRLSLMIGRNNTLYGNMSAKTGGYTQGVLDLTTSSNGTTVWNTINYSSYTRQESESLDFETVGKVVTGDGRTLDFNMQISMSRDYVESVESLEDTTAIMTDPLVISLDSNPVSVSDQKWKFDVDGDGVVDNISLLSKGQGFLVYDKNGDGIINNGLEMFGAATGNGFSELMEYDDDNNGWIDEKDSIYSKLSVWLKDDTGNDRLISLKEANVGALYLGSMETDYSLKSDTDNSHNAQIRRSGMYLSEDGTAKSMTQLDMVKTLC